jgi:hypothetical protein
LTHRWARRLLALAAATLAGLSAAGCGGSSPTPQATLHNFLADWSRADWPAMQRLAGDPAADFAAVNAATFGALGVHAATFSVGGVTESGTTATAHVTERFALPGVGVWTARTVVRLRQRHGRWLVAWTPETINPSLHAGERLVATETWPVRAPILGAGGRPLTTDGQQVTVGLVGSRIKDRSAVTTDLIDAGATKADVTTAMAQAKAHPTYFEPVFQVTTARFHQLESDPGPHNVYSVTGTDFQLTTTRSAITPQLAAHIVGTVGPITAEQLHQLGLPYTASSQVGQDGLELIDQRRLAGTPRTQIVVADGPEDGPIIARFLNALGPGT